MSEAWKANVARLTVVHPVTAAPPIPWVAFAAESVDDWVASQLTGYVPQVNFAEIRDASRSDQRVSALFERTMSRRTDLLGLQSAAYTRALQFRAFAEMRSPVRRALAAGNSSAASHDLAAGMASAQQAFHDAGDALSEGFAQNSGAVSTSSQLISDQQAEASAATAELLAISEKIQDDVEAMQSLERGPFDYEGRYLRMRELYLNDFKSLVECADNYFRALNYLADPRITVEPIVIPDFHNPTYIWKVGPLLQRLSSLLYSYKSKRIYRTLSIKIGFPAPNNELINRHRMLASSISLENWQTQASTPNPISFYTELPIAYFNSIGATNPRLEAFGLQWIDLLSPEQAKLTEKNYTVACGVGLPDTGIPNHPNSFVYFEESPTTLVPAKDVAIDDSPHLRGLRPYGRWTFTVGDFRNFGSIYPRTYALGVPPSNLPNIVGIILHMIITVDECQGLPPLGPLI